MSKKNLILIFMATLIWGGLAYSKVDPGELSKGVAARFNKVPEFKFIQEEADKLGVKVYLFGGTASAFAHYVRWDLEREAGDDKYQEERFDYDFTNIYRGNQDLDIVVDGTAEQAWELRKALMSKYPHFMGTRDAWEVRLLKTKMGDKLPLLGDQDFLNQHTDSNSTGLLALNDSNDHIFRDLRSWNNPESEFLQNVANAEIKYLYNDNHTTTIRYKKGFNPPILSAIRYLAKLTQFDLKGSDEDLEKVRSIIAEQDFSKLSKYAQKKVKEFSLKVLLNSPNVEAASSILTKVGLKAKLLELESKDEDVKYSISWWMNKKPLSSKPLGRGIGKTAAELFEKNENGDIIISHETESFAAYESIVRATTGGANVFISRKNKVGESAHHGDGFYTQLGQTGARGTGFTIRFKLSPKAIEGKDFEYIKKGLLNYVVVTNKLALEVIPEEIDVTLKELFELLKSGVVGPNDQGLIEKLKRKYQRQGLNQADLWAIEKDLLSMEWTKENYYAFSFWFKSGFFKHNSEIILNFLRSENYKKDPFFRTLNYRLNSSKISKPLKPLKDLIYEDLAKVNFKEIFEEINKIGPISGSNRLEISILLSLFRVYGKVKNDEVLIAELDRLVLHLMKSITVMYGRGETAWLEKGEKVELADLASFLVKKVKATEHLDDDASLLFYSALKIKSFRERMKYHYGNLTIVATATSSMILPFALMGYYWGLGEGLPKIINYLAGIGGTGFLSLLSHEFLKNEIKLSSTRRLFIKQIQNFLKKDAVLGAKKSLTCTGILL